MKSDYTSGTWIPSDTAVSKYLSMFFKVSRVVTFTINCNVINSSAGTGYQLIKLTRSSYVPKTTMGQYVAYYGKYANSSTAAFADTMCALSVINIDGVAYIRTSTGNGFIKVSIFTSGAYCVI